MSKGGVFLRACVVVAAFVFAIVVTPDRKPALHKDFVAACEKTGGTAVFNAKEWVCLK